MPTTDSISDYNAALPPGQQELAKLLRAEYDKALPKASSKVWHGHPVWFDGGNAVVGYDARKASVNILFWNGQALGEAALEPVGKFRAAGTKFEKAADVDVAALRRWLEKARTNVFDGVTYFAALRAKAAKAKAPAAKAKAPAAKAKASGAKAKAPAAKAKKGSKEIAKNAAKKVVKKVVKKPAPKAKATTKAKAAKKASR